MTGEEVVSLPKYTVGPQQGCCGIASVTRLAGTYPSASTIKKQFGSWARQADKGILFPATSTAYTSWTLHRLVNLSQIKPEGFDSPDYWCATAIPISIGYAAVLSEMRRFNQSLYFMSDNMSNQGDCHIGAFSTRFFVKWLTDMNLGTFQTSGPVISRRTGRFIQGWMFTPNIQACDTMVARKKEDMLALIKEWNSDTRIKGKDQATRKAAAQKSEAVTSAILDGWYLADSS